MHSPVMATHCLKLEAYTIMFQNIRTFLSLKLNKIVPYILGHSGIIVMYVELSASLKISMIRM